MNAGCEWESNPQALQTRKLFILCFAQNRRNDRNAEVKYTACTRQAHAPNGSLGCACLEIAISNLSPGRKTADYPNCVCPASGSLTQNYG